MEIAKNGGDKCFLKGCNDLRLQNPWLLKELLGGGRYPSDLGSHQSSLIELETADSGCWVAGTQGLELYASGLKTQRDGVHFRAFLSKLDPVAREMERWTYVTRNSNSREINTLFWHVWAVAQIWCI